MPIAELAGRLSTDHLHIVVFGPGYGESIAVFIPDGGWLICDSLSRPHGSADFVPAVELLTSREERAAALMLTHPHDDHVGGFDRLVTRFANGPVGLVGLHLPEEDFTEDDDASRILATSNRTKALAAISTYWDQHPERKWELAADDAPLQIGRGTIEVLHPDNAYLAAGNPDPAAAPNAYSTPVLICWEAARIVLGADLPKTQWAPVLGSPREKELADHGALKVPHHGSTGALPVELVHSGDRGNVAMMTPWHLGRGLLPKLEDRGGVAWILDRRSAVSLTAPGRALTRDLPQRVSLTDLAEAVERRPLPGGAASVEVKKSYDPDESWIAATFNRRGGLDVVDLGRDAHLIVQSDSLSGPWPYPQR